MTLAFAGGTSDDAEVEVTAVAPPAGAPSTHAAGEGGPTSTGVAPLAGAKVETEGGDTGGPHSVQAEFVATDHAPFANRVVAAVLFTVSP